MGSATGSACSLPGPALARHVTGLASLCATIGPFSRLAQQGRSVSSWLADAAADRLRNELLGAALDAWEVEDGPFTQQELDDATAALGVRRQTPAA